MKKYRVLVILVLWSILGMSLISPVWASELFGKIIYKGKPLQNAEVTVKDKKIKTNDIGYYSVSLDPGSYALGIKLPDGSIKTEKVDVFPQSTEKNLRLE